MIIKNGMKKVNPKGLLKTLKKISTFQPDLIIVSVLESTII